MACRAHRIPAWLMLPMVVAAAEHQPLLGPNDLRTDGEAIVRKTVRNRRGVQGAVPDVGDVAREQGPSGSPVCLVVITDFAPSSGMVDAQAMTPSRIVVDPVGRVGDHESGF